MGKQACDFLERHPLHLCKSSTQQHSKLYFIMNTFKTVVMICAMLGASCSGQYLSQSSNQGSQPGLGGMMSSSQMPSYVAQSQQSSPALEQQRPAFTADQSRPGASGSSPLLSGATTAPATTQQICSCITINPAAPAAAAAAQQSAPVSSSSADSTAAQQFAAPQQQSFAAPQQQTFSAPQQQTFAAPAQQQTYAAPAAQSYSTAPAVSQQGPAQRPSSAGY
uniref:Uncharacterized protein n=1 Tax=Daphnia galeata TaxID=27404 RepID=A0A8J2RX25_9CRUS|nr:unnamed protein product [Daphnia galeata]